jgi:dihydrofolate synthase / folylpolyglutamate synthase
VTYDQTLQYLFSQLPMFHRIGPAAYKPGLDNTIALLHLVGNPHLGIKTVHIAGTNGKGSTSHLIASALQEAGFKTGLYTSPHLKDFRERIRINGVMIPENEVMVFVEQYKDHWQNIQPSFFEITVALCFWYFKKMNLDIAVIETGLGGRLDSTNVIIPEVSVITNIGFDHMNLLGDTIEKIASEKAGIIKSETSVVLGPMRSAAREVMLSTAASKNANVVDASLLSLDETPSSSLKGKYQEENRRTAYATLKCLQQKFPQISEDHIARGFINVTENTGLLGRWQLLGENPLIIADVGHNEDGMRMILDQVSQTPHSTIHFVIGMVNDKDIVKILSMLPTQAKYYFCKADIPRGLDATLLKNEAENFQLIGDVYPSVKDAFSAAKQKANKSDLILIAGSVFTVAEVI